ncbi:Alpha/Beta hydrolase protein [Blakeslea trispora]|nr:Alpha/Beta hydrolase protein [Blakeslea trispora]
MNSIRSKLRKLPPKAVIKVLRKVFAMPVPAARLILNEITKARTCHRPWIYRVKLDPKVPQDWSGCWIGHQIHHLDREALMKRVYEADVVLFYVHGIYIHLCGGFRIGSCTMYMDTMISWIQILKEKYGLSCMIMSIDYRLAPEYRYPSPVEDVVRAYEHLVHKLGVNHEKVVVMGDSAGSALLLEMLFITHDPSMFEIVTEEEDGAILNELPRPAGAVLISPLVTDETTSASWKENQKYDYITYHTAKVVKNDYFPSSYHASNSSLSLQNSQPQDHDAEDEEDQDGLYILGIAKLQTGFKAFLPPEVLMYIGEFEVLRDDALQLAKKVQDDDVSWQTVMEPNVHDWFCVREVVKDKETIRRADHTFADFCYRAIGGPTRVAPKPVSPISLPPRDRGLGIVKEEYDDDHLENSSSFDTDSPNSNSSLFTDLSKLTVEDRKAIDTLFIQ